MKDQAQNSHGHGHGYGHRAFISSACHKGRREQSYFFAVSDHFALGIEGFGEALSFPQIVKPGFNLF